MIKIMNIENASEKDILTRDIKLESGVESVEGVESTTGATVESVEGRKGNPVNPV